MKKMEDVLSQVLDSEQGNVVDALFEIATALHRCANQLERLGLGNSSTDMGAIELLAKEIKEGLNNVSVAMDRT